jgi:cyclopropane fatty-acyl-phospholipid synthase-like methyltransferase
MLAPRKTLHSTPLLVFSGALERLKVQPKDVLYDIGCGDGRCVIEAAQKYGIKAVGIEIDGERVLQARQKAKDAGVDHLVTIYKGNALDFDFSEATIIFLFLIERGLK